MILYTDDITMVAVIKEEIHTEHIAIVEYLLLKTRPSNLEKSEVM